MSGGSKVFCTIFIISSKLIYFSIFYQGSMDCPVHIAPVLIFLTFLLKIFLFFNSSVHLNITCAISIIWTFRMSCESDCIFRMTIAVVSCSSSSVWHGYKDLEQNVLRKWNIFTLGWIPREISKFSFLRENHINHHQDEFMDFYEFTL